jgi:hypothetical protein
VQQHHIGVLGADFGERVPDARVIVAVGPAVNAPAGASNSVSARRRAARNSQLSIIEAVRAR